MSETKWGYDPWTGKVDYDRGNREMCDYGARQVASGTYDVLSLSVMPGEVESIRSYMAEHHPTIRYFFA